MITPFAKELSWIDGTTASPSTAALHFRKVIVLRGKPVSARLRFSALGVLEPWLNGARVAEDYFTPGWSDYRKRAYVSEYEVSAQLQPGSNCVGFVLADGWAGAAFGPKGHETAFAPRRQFIAELIVCYEDGSQEVFGTNDAWEWQTGPVLKQSIYDGETYDARKELVDWSLGAEGDWKSVDSLKAPEIELTPKKCAPVRITQTLIPQHLKQKNGDWVADFGQNLVGVFRIRLKNTMPGQKIVFRFAEILEADQEHLYFDNLRGACATDVYLCKGAAEESYQPHFTFHGFRYAQISGLNGPLSPDDLTACVLHNDLDPTGSFSCSNPMVNQLQSCIKWGQRGNFLEAPTDCPQRDERLGWSGDAQVFVETACFNYDCEGFYRQWMDAMRDGQRTDGAFPDVAPDILGWHGNAGWADAGIIVPHAVWLHYGSTTIVEENWSAMELYFEFLKEQSIDFIQPETAFGDWLAVDAVKPEWGPTPKDMIGTAYFARDAALMSRMASALGKATKAKEYTALEVQIREAFQRHYITQEGLILGDTQTSYLLALAFDLVPEHLVAAAGERLVQRIEARDWHLSTGFLGTPLLNPVLTKIGRSEVAYKLLLQDTYPSWLYPITNGATTMWERWNSYTKEDGFGPVEMNSFNHYAYGAVGEWLYQSVGGIAPDPAHPGYKVVRIAPQMEGPLHSARLSLKARSGTFQVRWKCRRGSAVMKITVPHGCLAHVDLPTSKWQSVELNGEAVTRKYKLSPRTQAACRLSLPTGSFEVKCLMANV